VYGHNLKIEIGGDGMGEVNEGLLTIIKTCSDLGFNTTFTTNAYLINRRILKRIIDETGLKCLVFSLDYTTPEKHDNQRGMNNSYKHVLDLLEHVKAFEVQEVVLSCIIMKPNLSELIQITKFVDQSKQITQVQFQAIAEPLGLAFSEPWFQDKNYSYLWPGTSKVTKVIDNLIEMKKKGSKIANSISQLNYFKHYFKHPLKYAKKNSCNAENLGMEIDVDGQVSICNRMKKLGSLKQHSISELLAINYKILAKEISNCSLNCHLIMNCRFSEE